MGNKSELMVSPVGRFVSGSITEKQKVGYQNKPIPEEKQMYEFGVAFRKDDPASTPMLQAIATHALQEYANAPHIQQLIQSFNFGIQGFSWKISDGDKPNQRGQINQNTVGHWVIWFSSMYIRFCDQNNADFPAENIKRGSYVMVAFTVAGNDAMDNQAGIYINPQIVKFVAFGEEIIGGVSADEAFANSPIPQQLPPGASLTPVGSAMNTGVDPAAGFGSHAPGQPPMQQGLPQGTHTTGGNMPPTTGYPGNPNAMGNAGVQPDMGATSPMGGMPAQPLTGFSTGQPGMMPAGTQQQPGMPGVQQPGAPGMMPAGTQQQPGMPGMTQ